MIKHHPQPELLEAFVNGELPTPVSVAVAIHVEMCEASQQKVAELEAKAAEQHFGTSVLVDDEAHEAELDFQNMIDAITQDATLDTVVPEVLNKIEVGGKQFTAPKALQKLENSDWKTLGKLSRSRVQLDDVEARSSLLWIDAGGEVPLHTHKGFEITLLLDGSFSDDMGTYNKGDFIWLDGKHEHQPRTEEGCLCYTVVSDALHFTQGMSRLLNPIGKLIY